MSTGNIAMIVLSCKVESNAADVRPVTGIVTDKKNLAQRELNCYEILRHCCMGSENNRSKTISTHVFPPPSIHHVQTNSFEQIRICDELRQFISSLRLLRLQRWLFSSMLSLRAWTLHL